MARNRVPGASESSTSTLAGNFTGRLWRALAKRERTGILGGIMQRTGYATLLVVVMALYAAAPLQATLSQKPESAALPQPTRGQQPEDVVRIVIEALARNDEPYPDAGIETTFAFASPANKIQTGPLSKFTQMVRNPAYGIMINHAEHEFSEVVLMGDEAYQMVRIKGASGAQVIFAFRLSQQQDGEFAGMWMTDAVWPVASGDIPEQAF